MNKSNVAKLLLTGFILFFGCHKFDEQELIELEQENVLYQHYPEFQTDVNIQNDPRALALLQYLAENPDIFGINEIGHLHVATEKFYANNPNGRTASQELWELILSDSTVVIHDIIFPIYSFESSENGRISSNHDCDCVSTATGLKLPKDLCYCGEEDEGGSGGGSTSTGWTGSSTVGISYGSPSSVESFFTSLGGGGGLSSGSNSNEGASGSLFLLTSNTPLDLVLGLDENESDWLSNNPTLENDIKAFLVENLNSPESIKFSQMAVNALINGGEVDFDERLVYDPHQDQNYKSRMAEQEREIFDELSAAQKIAYLMSAQQAWNYAKSYHGDSFYNGLGDAVRHSFWNALSTVRIGKNLTKQLADAHETKPDTYEFSYKETEMDIFNNMQGRATAFMAGRLYQLLEKALSNGGLRYLNNLTGPLAPKQGKATAKSQLMPTNQ